MIRRNYLIVSAMVMALVGFVSGPAAAQTGRTFYIDYASGSNSNPGTKTSPWKTHPYMQARSDCTSTGSAPAYTHQAGDHFIFKGGVTWPAACFSMTISGSGSSPSTVSSADAAPTINGADYYGVDLTWFTGGSFTRPIFDLANTTPTGTNGAVITTTGNNITLDDIEIKRNLLNGVGGQCQSATINTDIHTGIVLDRMYLHDWTIADLSKVQTGHFDGSICGRQATGGWTQQVYNTEMSDAATTATMPFGSCYFAIGTVAWSNCHDVAEAGLFTHGSFHANQIHDLDGSAAARARGNVNWHSNGYESDGSPPKFYNNLMYNLNIDFNSFC